MVNPADQFTLDAGSFRYLADRVAAAEREVAELRQLLRGQHRFRAPGLVEAAGFLAGAGAAATYGSGTSGPSDEVIEWSSQNSSDATKMRCIGSLATGQVEVYAEGFVYAIVQAEGFWWANSRLGEGEVYLSFRYKRPGDAVWSFELDWQERLRERLRSITTSNGVDFQYELNPSNNAIDSIGTKHFSLTQIGSHRVLNASAGNPARIDPVINADEEVTIRDASAMFLWFPIPTGRI